ncbi:helix-turn-helix domain-containing protein [Miltoncostaea marina]|uniref:helix-turn-helix domain-containing protein n=1 Tax=Miltoncostaea marina TaxID=2843215 RepID=UPI003CCE9841
MHTTCMVKTGRLACAAMLPTKCTPEELALVSEARRLAGSGGARAIRVAAGVTLYEVAAACGVYPSTVLRWERGERRPRGRGAVHYARVLRELASPPRRVQTT